MTTQYFVLVGSLCLLVALVQAWLLVVRFASDTGPLARLIPGRQDLLRSHIDYLMMALFLFVFFLLYRAFAVTPPMWVVVSACIGSFFNPFAFFVRALRPDYLKRPAPMFTAMITTSCILATVGYGTSAVLFARAALAAG